MESNKMTRGFFILLVAITLVAGWLGYWILQRWTGHYFAAYPLIPVYFLAFGTVYLFVMKRSNKKTPQRMLMSFMGLRMLKLVLSVILLAIYGLGVGIQTNEFIITFLVYYLVYLLIEMGFFFCLRDGKEK